ncbi:hypothetical protein M426DRAFT_24355 [Hypoxylon sp. CI-4A]|nr:hypothetical protein M426DRAFT_24355 [Hypoxylon sp. CI-4A]
MEPGPTTEGKIEEEEKKRACACRKEKYRRGFFSGRLLEKTMTPDWFVKLIDPSSQGFQGLGCSRAVPSTSNSYKFVYYLVPMETEGIVTTSGNDSMSCNGVCSSLRIQDKRPLQLAEASRALDV